MIRLGAVSYLNTKPLIYALEESSAQLTERFGVDFDLSLDLPSRLADQLEAGLLDVALVPIVETFRHEHWTIISDACIACRGPVWSVKLLSRVPLEDIRSVALDEGSRTSAMMVRVMLTQGNPAAEGADPLAEIQFQQLPIDAAWQQIDTDAVLIIGDRAMNCQDNRFQYQWDLGQWWNDTFELPFVFAAWAARAELAAEGDQLISQIGSMLNSSRDAGCDQLVAIALEQAGNYQLSNQRCLEYLRDNLKFRLGDQEKSGIQRFLDLTRQWTQVTTPELTFHD